MVRVSNGIVCIFNFVYLLVAVPIISAGIWFKTAATNDCQRMFQWPLIALGVSLLVLCLLGIFGSCCRINFLLWIYLFFMFLLILVMLAATISVVVVLHSNVLKDASGKGVMDYKVGDYSRWLDNKVAKYENWVRIQECLKQAEICDDGNTNPKVFAFAKSGKLLQSGCCVPPPSCGFTSVNSTYWSPPKSFPPENADCKTWSNDAAKLCYECDTCKGAVLTGLRSQWKNLAVLCSILLVLIVFMYSIGCCAFRNNRGDRHKHYRGYG